MSFRKGAEVEGAEVSYPHRVHCIRPPSHHDYVSLSCLNIALITAVNPANQPRTERERVSETEDNIGVVIGKKPLAAAAQNRLALLLCIKLHV